MGLLLHLFMRTFFILIAIFCAWVVADYFQHSPKHSWKRFLVMFFAFDVMCVCILLLVNC